ncbi:NADPH:quinone reductase [Streptomyces eurocidicus]|uniref:NADPH:quinone reductase n=1 Tax=Streptomyces eurocidicus TaxID=66423 RepID=A0A2N8NVF5_STREU|nr:zinc-binding dehydrogenase [Streptomyces eurocidicus]MBB5122484.1 NADPH:quinone reductase-like Zn-dependent oxidoreductase [Streptomyces eurocidicus]MBF6052109.1 zinc-binding dehydrogenase [Streptomyces eurocidicus]PNE32712.1 NADPH:quinone reductase [Streptomyces eurocidicus]
MRRVRYHENGGPEVLRVEETEVPRPGPGELLLRTEAVGVTLPVVRKVREGGLALPAGLGGEVAGPVVAVGPDVTGFAVGDLVTGLCFGDGYADRSVVLSAMASPVPDGASATDAVALVRCGLVARGAYEAARPAEGESVMVTAAASGAGHLAVQLAKARGAGRVVAAVGSAAKADFVRSLGADEVVTYEELAGPAPLPFAPVDIVLDAVGGELLSPAVAALAPGGRLVAYSSGGGTVEAYDLLVGAKSVVGFQMALIARHRPELMERWRRELWEDFAAGRVRPRIHAELPLEEAATAHGIIESRVNLGKVVLRPM